MPQTQNIYYAHNLIKCTGERMISKTEPPQTAEQVGYVLNATREKIDFNYHPHLIQRIEITDDGSVSFQYMGSSEFEDGCVGRAQHKMIGWLAKMELMLVEQDGIEVLCHPLMIDEALMQAQDLLAENPSLRPLEPLMPERYSNFLCVDNAYFFSKKGGAQVFLKRLKAQHLLQLHQKSIIAHPHYETLQELVRTAEIFLRGKVVGLFSIHLSTYAMAHRTFGKQLEEGDFTYCISINSGSKHICGGMYDPKDLESLFTGDSPIFTPKYHLDQGNFIEVAKGNSVPYIEEMIAQLSERSQGLDFTSIIPLLLQNDILTSSIGDTLIFSRFFTEAVKSMTDVTLLLSIIENPLISSKAVEKIGTFVKSKGPQGVYQKALKQRQENREALGQKTLEDIQKVFLTGEHTSQFTKKPEMGFLPSRLNINFHNNLSRMGLKCKELNVYVEPKTYEKASNEILIWEPEHQGASVWVGPLDYTSIKGYIDVEERTGQLMISSGNIASCILNREDGVSAFTFNVGHGNGSVIIDMLKGIKALKGVNLSTIFWLFSRMEDVERGVKTSDTELWTKTARQEVGLEQLGVLKSVDITRDVVNYLEIKYPGEMTKEEYEGFAKELERVMRVEVGKVEKFLG